MAKAYRYWQVFDDRWFERYQSWLVRAVNLPLIGRWCRRALALKLSLPVLSVTPDAVHYRQDDRQSIAHCYPFPHHSRAIYDALKPLWWAMHYWDELIADRWTPELSFGFDQLTAYTGRTQVENFDGSITSTSATSYFNARSGTSGASEQAISIGIGDNVDALINLESSRFSTSPNQWAVGRGYLRFNLTTIPVGNIVTASQLFLSIVNKQNSDLFSVVLTSWPAANNQTTLSVSDWTSSATLVSTASPDRYGSRTLSTYGISSPPDYYGLQLNANGRTYLQGKASTYASLCIRHSRDAEGGTPSNTNTNSATFAASEYKIGSTYYGPYIEITYERVVLLAGFTVTVVFGSPSISQSQPIVRLNGLPVTVTFGLPSLRGSSTTMSVNGFAVNVTFGTPSVSTIQLNGFAVNVDFGLIRIPVIQPVGLAISVVFGEPALVRGRIIRPNGFAVTATFGSPQVGAVQWTVSPTGFPITVSFGFVTLEIPYPDGILITGPYISRIIDQPIEYDATTYEFEDGTAVVNVQPAGIRRWRLEYDGLTEAELNQLVRHFNAMRGKSTAFKFYHRRDLVTYTGVRYVSMDIPSHTRAWVRSAVVILEKLK